MWDENMTFFFVIQISHITQSSPSIHCPESQGTSTRLWLSPSVAGFLPSIHIWALKILVWDQLVADVRALKSQGSELGQIYEKLHSHMFYFLHMKELLCKILGHIAITTILYLGSRVILAVETYCISTMECTKMKSKWPWWLSTIFVKKCNPTPYLSRWWR